MKMLKKVFGFMTFGTFVSIIDSSEGFVLNIITNSSNKNKIYIFFKRSSDFFIILQTNDIFINEMSACLYFTGTGSDNVHNRNYGI